jgi:hypothetical protein
VPEPGWYEDPDGKGGLRYWDGRGWTESHAKPPDAHGASRREQDLPDDKD